MSDQQKDSSTEFMLILFVILGLVFLVYYLFKVEILSVYLTLKLWQLKLVSLIYKDETTDYIINELINRPLKDWDFAEVRAIGGYVGMQFNIIFAAIIGYISYKIWKKNPQDKLKRVLNMKTLKQSEQTLWPYIAPVVDIDLIKEPLDSGPYAMAIPPYEYAVKYKLLSDESNTSSLDKVKAEKLFASQLGRLWAGFDRMKKHEQAIFAVCAAYGCGDRAGAMKAVGELAKSAAQNPNKMPDFSCVKPLLKYVNDENVLEAISKHAYVNTVLAEMMLFSRRSGVFAASFFVWLKPRDRTLFYVLNCVGRQVSFVEVAGIYGHWRAEQVANHKLEIPYVAKAVEGFERALSEVKVKVKDLKNKK